ncbi:SDR family oxidoreductase [Mesorhizobium sp. M7A.F.Ca.CA.001.07.2.1]|uniref:dTDP-4-dehydrorhamnose reductase family protein n=6 Tax=Phyllobacteriaceae TaxID=69277 RepID=UPI000FCC4AFB|nr:MULTISPECIES: SDR family oxidoreductase [Mesorhizobium]RVB46015.1 SDR family oxidoreductase [Mesorhizobium sp. M7A.F.Ca.CA.004.05.1.1]MCF6121603.1 SDR family oxidoreductase [Mesorhizobium ciceri]MCQ8812182.1 SDR family oxidoreductase [Mesorhizobium sp. SEMIA396]RUX81656.1 SDR family oxidoreductase [Mesorhizobium sp. M7A.F.Ca.CA.004.08.2.1]RUY06797.1 SDR family oxidoreductase [Mesorhizobium sp. M7A.F.Ca.CA.004.04.1.1]
MAQSTHPRILVLGASGMLGNAVFRFFANSEGYVVFGSTRSNNLHPVFPESRATLIDAGDVENFDGLSKIFAVANPDVVINCIGLVKQMSSVNDPLAAIPINAVLPHRLARLCAVARARLVHISTDCVFDGAAGNYSESARPNADDLYGRSKLLGEVVCENSITLRTSIIGRELNTSHGLVDWFLSQQADVKGFTRAVFSGLPTVELARIIRDFVLPNIKLTGVYHVSSDPISKYDLLRIIAEVYGKKTQIVPDDQLVIDRSLNSSRFQNATGYRPPDWPVLIRSMYDFG